MRDSKGTNEAKKFCAVRTLEEGREGDADIWVCVSVYLIPSIGKAVCECVCLLYAGVRMCECRL